MFERNGLELRFDSLSRLLNSPFIALMLLLPITGFIKTITEKACFMHKGNSNRSTKEWRLQGREERETRTKQNIKWTS